MRAMPVINMAKTGKNIKQLMDDVGMTALDLQRIFGFGSRNPIYRWINGENLPTLDNILILSDALSVPVEQILVVDRRE